MSLNINPCVSVIIPYFNCYKYIEETLQSVILQSHNNIEIIVVNDGSDDKNTSFLESLLKEYPNIIYRHQNNQGVSSARNTGAMLAKGEFLVFLDADDKLAPTYIEKTLTYLLANLDCKAVYSRAKLFDGDTGEWQLPDYIDFRDLLIANKILTSALHRRTDFLAIGGFDVNLATYEDWDYWIRLLKDGGVAKRLDEILLYHRKRQDNTSLTDDLLSNATKNRMAWQKVCQKHSDIYVAYQLSHLDFFETLTELEKQKQYNQDLLITKQNLDSLNQKLNKSIQHLSSSNDSLTNWNKSLIEHNQRLETKLHQFKKLWLIKLLKPFIKLEQGLHSLNRYRKQFRKLKKYHGGFDGAYQTLNRIHQKDGFKSAKQFLKNYNPNQNTMPLLEHTPNYRDFSLDGGITVLCTRHTHYIGKLLQQSLNIINVQCDIIFEMPKNGYNDRWHIVVCPQMFETLPKHYIAFQMEQSVSSRWFNEDYFNRLKNAKFVFDYSLRNIEFLQKNGIAFGNLFYLPIGILNNNPNTNKNFEYDIAFYGDPNCERRKEFLSELQKHCSVKIISEVFGDDLYDLLKKCKIIINIHYYENALLETTRLYECLHLNKVVVSEKGSDQDEHQDLETFKCVAEIGDVDAMVDKVKQLLSKPELIDERIETIKQQKTQKDKFQFYFYRFLLAQDLLEFDDFYHLVSGFIKPQGDFWCLSLPESIQRRADFIKDNHYNAWLFTGLRHHIGWVGCGLSYKFMLKLADELKLPQVAICEDDVLFDVDFDKRYQAIKYDLENNANEWDVFSGLIADLSKDIKLSHATLISSNEQYYQVNKLVSMVFNIYNHSIYKKISEWDYHYRNTSNTIDRYIENLGAIKGIITEEFLVGHKEELSSTLWGFQNTQYSQMIADSQALLSQKINELNSKG